VHGEHAQVAGILDVDHVEAALAVRLDVVRVAAEGLTDALEGARFDVLTEVPLAEIAPGVVDEHSGVALLVVDVVRLDVDRPHLVLVGVADDAEPVRLSW
jgi:hypothetical protein